MARARWYSLLVILGACAFGPGCGGNGHTTERDFVARTDVEHEARARIVYWVEAATGVLEDDTLPEVHEIRLRAAISATRAALSTYQLIRGRGATRGAIMAPLRLSAAGILADDVTVIGVGDNVLLIPIALAAITTYAITDARASASELGQAWNQVLNQSGELGKAVSAAMAAAAVGTRQHCIDLYVDCQQTAVRGFPLERCFACMELCTGSGEYRWPDRDDCKYKKRRRKPGTRGRH